MTDLIWENTIINKTENKIYKLMSGNFHIFIFFLYIFIHPFLFSFHCAPKIQIHNLEFVSTNLRVWVEWIYFFSKVLQQSKLIFGLEAALKCIYSNQVSIWCSLTFNIKIILVLFINNVIYLHIVFIICYLACFKSAFYINYWRIWTRRI